jgi:hypothetical protein
MTQEQIWEKELREAGWTPNAVHPRAPAWCAPNSKVYIPGPGYAWSVMKQLERDAQKV